MKPTEELLKPTNNNQNSRFSEEHKEKLCFSNARQTDVCLHRESNSFSCEPSEAHLKKAEEIYETIPMQRDKQLKILATALAEAEEKGRQEIEVIQEEKYCKKCGGLTYFKEGKMADLCYNCAVNFPAEIKKAEEKGRQDLIYFIQNKVSTLNIFNYEILSSKALFNNILIFLSDLNEKEKKKMKPTEEHFERIEIEKLRAYNIGKIHGLKTAKDIIGRCIEKAQNKLKTLKSKTPRVIIIDNNPLSLSGYAEEYPENWKKICEGLKDVKSN